MASHKDANNSKKRAYDILDNSKMCNEEGRNDFICCYRQRMVLTTLIQSHVISQRDANNKRGSLQAACKIKQRKQRKRNLSQCRLVAGVCT